MGCEMLSSVKGEDEARMPQSPQIWTDEMVGRGGVGGDGVLKSQTHLHSSDGTGTLVNLFSLADLI